MVMSVQAFCTRVLEVLQRVCQLICGDKTAEGGTALSTAAAAREST